jgi:hypothetical protein
VTADAILGLCCRHGPAPRPLGEVSLLARQPGRRYDENLNQENRGGGEYYSTGLALLS